MFVNTLVFKSNKNVGRVRQLSHGHLWKGGGRGQIDISPLLRGQKAAHKLWLPEKN